MQISPQTAKVDAHKVVDLLFVGKLPKDLKGA